jgi:phosphatidylethanolamine-binding protein (PEBP) family uncharacterized protein
MSVEKSVHRFLLLTAALALLACSSSDNKKIDSGSVTGGVGGASGSGGGGTGGGGSGGGGSGGVGGGGMGGGGRGGTGGGGTGGGGMGGGGMGGGGMGGGAGRDAGADSGARDMGGGARDMGGGGASFAVTAPWADGAMIDAMYTCSGNNRFPMITWTEGPAGTMGYAFTFFDTANSLVHIAMVNIPATARSMPPVPMDARVVNGVGNTNNTTWGGPCPPMGGQPHVYQITIYALRTPTFMGGNGGTAIRTSLEGNNPDVLAKVRVSGRYGR